MVFCDTMASICRFISSMPSHSTSVSSYWFCMVLPVLTPKQYAPILSVVLMSALTPAPDDGSKPAMLITNGVVIDCQLLITSSNAGVAFFPQSPPIRAAPAKPRAKVLYILSADMPPSATTGLSIRGKRSASGRWSNAPR